MKTQIHFTRSIFFVFFSIAVGLLLANVANDLGLTLATRKIVQSIAMTLVIVPAVILVLTKLDRLPLKSLFNESLTRSTLKFCMGAGLILVPMVLHFTIALSSGWVRPVTEIDASVVLSILGVMAYAFFYEAFPEELALRGYIFGRLNSRMVKWKAFFLTLFIFIALPIFSGLLLWLAVGNSTEISNALKPEYLLTLFLMGFFIQIVRVSFNSFWAGMGIHFSILISDRIIGTSKGHSIQLEVLRENSTEMPLLIVWLCMIILIMVFYPKLRGRNWGWKEIDKMLGENH